MVSRDENAYAPPIEPATPLPRRGVDPQRRPPFVSAILCLALLLLTNLPLARRDHVPSFGYVIGWTIVLAAWVSTIVHRIHALSMPRPRSSRGLAMVSACVGVLMLWLGMQFVGRPLPVVLLPFGVVIAIIVSYVRAQSKSATSSRN